MTLLRCTWFILQMVMAGKGTFSIEVACGEMPIITGVLFHLSYMFAINWQVSKNATTKAIKKKALQDIETYIISSTYYFRLYTTFPTNSMPNRPQISVHAVRFLAESLPNYSGNFAIEIYKFSASSVCSPCCALCAQATQSPFIYRQRTRLAFPNCLHLIKLSLSNKTIRHFHWLNPLLQFAWLIVVSVALNNWNNTVSCDFDIGLSWKACGLVVIVG